MRKVSFQLKVSWEGDPGRGVDLQESLTFPNHCDDDSVGFNTANFAKIVFYLLIQAICKGVQYGKSWQKRGELRSIAANLDRKYDRLDKSFQDMEVHDHNDPEGRTDGASDLAVYCLLYLSTFLYEHYFDAYNKWWTGDVLGFIRRFRNGNQITDNQGRAIDQEGMLIEQEDKVLVDQPS